MTREESTIGDVYQIRLNSKGSFTEVIISNRIETIEGKKGDTHKFLTGRLICMEDIVSNVEVWDERTRIFLKPKTACSIFDLNTGAGDVRIECYKTGEEWKLK